VDAQRSQYLEDIIHVLGRVSALKRGLWLWTFVGHPAAADPDRRSDLLARPQSPKGDSQPYIFWHIARAAERSVLALRSEQ
jgi:hypothetical protein